MNRARVELRRIFRRRRRQIEGTYEQTEEQLDKLFFRRLGRLGDVRRFVATWVLLILLLIGGVAVQARGLSRQYQSLQPVPGGTYTEGLYGTFSNANPLYTTSIVDNTIAKLVFSSLLTYDGNNHLVGDLARSWEVDDRAATYTVHLRPNLHWHDGEPLTADDVLFTYKTIQNPDAKSPLFSSWVGVNVTAPNSTTVVFTLPSALSSFPYSLTNGIVPKHLLDGVPATGLRSVAFNTSHPIGSGPFIWQSIEVTGKSVDDREQRISLTANGTYHRGTTLLGQYVVRTFLDTKRLEKAFNNQELTAVADAESFSEKKSDGVFEYSVPLTSAVMVFLNNSQEILKDVRVREALVQATDTGKVIASVGHPVTIANSPFLSTQNGYDRNSVQQPFNLAAANKLLDDAGWKRAKDGDVRMKDGKKLTIGLFSQSTGEYANISKVLQAQWAVIGVNLEPKLQPAEDLQGGTLARHEYDALLYGISIGADPDVFAFWHSSQADARSVSRLNLSEYRSVAADRALEAGRSRTEPALRAIKYRPFLDAWRVDAPAIALYQPRFLYLSHSKIYGFNATTLNIPSDRLNNVFNWMIRQEKSNR